MDLKNEVISIKDEIIKLRRNFHMNPELGFEEYETSKFIKEYLDKEGISYESYAKTGVCGIIRGDLEEKKDRVIGLRSDIDALPIEENNKCEYISTVKGKMHACGHDGHAAILLGVAKILNRNRELFGGTIKLIFEPAEETIGGARYMIEEGVLTAPNVDIMCGLHLDENINCGQVEVKFGAVNAASNPFKVEVMGVGGHGAYPSSAIDPIVISSNIINALQNIVSREVNPLNSAVITVGSIHGGTGANIIPEKVTLTGIIRTLNSEDRQLVTRRVDEIAKGIGLTLRGKVKIEIEESYPMLINDKNSVNKLRNAAIKVIGEENVLEQEYPHMGVESFAYFANEIPSVFYFLGCRNEEKGIIHPAHSSLFDIDEDALMIGVAIQCQMVLDYLTN
ncbi:amidohydrolase [Clostridium sp. NSJ-6]|uniref:Amidohydrolase n=1 Tax=Clostridium hominis TaxID=2763036 RepID=A0ABR7DF68_9CLOT|nr:M20 family metallopeptidase [Clostridium hominis]MBC5630041.1 amidohydrolase [Clostridium hominis]